MPFHTQPVLTCPGSYLPLQHRVLPHSNLVHLAPATPASFHASKMPDPFPSQGLSTRCSSSCTILSFSSFRSHLFRQAFPDYLGWNNRPVSPLHQVLIPLSYFDFSTACVTILNHIAYLLTQWSLAFLHPPLKCNFQEVRGLFYSLLSPLCQECLVCIRHSVHIYWLSKHKSTDELHLTQTGKPGKQKRKLGKIKF